MARMHADEVETNTGLVRRLLEGQFPQWAELEIERVLSAGTDNAIYRLGAELAVRLPRVEWATAQVEKEHVWLPRLAPHLPLAIPVPVAKGIPAEGYPWDWSICRWLEGETVTLERLAEPKAAARTLAEFIHALEHIDATGGPPAGAHNFGRGVPMARRDEATRAAIAASKGLIDEAAVTAAWEEALRAPVWEKAPVWIHGDLQAGNLLARDGRLRAVIDFGGLGVGDPACDLIVAWNFFDAEMREVFRETLGVDEATWARGRGWALSVALIALPYYLETNPVIAENSRRTIAEVMGEEG